MVKCIYLFFFLLVISCYGQYNLFPKRIVPEKVKLFFSSQNIDGVRHPVIFFRCYAGSNTAHWASSLHIDKIVYRDSIIVKILGYDYLDHTKYFNDNDLVFGFTLQISRKTIFISRDVLSENVIHKLYIDLNGKRNTFKIVRDNLKVKFIPIVLKNLEIFEHFAVIDPLEVLLIPNDVYKIYIAGAVKKDIEYIPYVIKFCKEHNLKIAKNIYPQIPVNKGRQVFVYSKELIDINTGYSKSLGHLAEFPEVQVLISRYSDFCDKISE